MQSPVVSETLTPAVSTFEVQAQVRALIDESVTRFESAIAQIESEIASLKATLQQKKTQVKHLRKSILAARGASGSGVVKAPRKSRKAGSNAEVRS